MNKIKAILLAAAMMIPLTACSAQQPETKKEAENNRETVYQVALLQSLTQGYYDGIIKVSELKQHGDTGIGRKTAHLLVFQHGGVFSAALLLRRRCAGPDGALHGGGPGGGLCRGDGVWEAEESV